MLWVLLAVILAVGEVMSLSLFLAPFALGALFGAAADLAGAGDAVAVIVFLVSSGLLFGFVRPIARRHMRTPAQLRTGTAALVGARAVVLERVDGDRGRVRIGGDVWSARSFNEDEVMEPGQRVEVLKIDGATALVSE